MCGRLNVIDDPAVVALCEALGIKIWPDNLDVHDEQRMPDGRPIPSFFKRFVRATDSIAIIREVDGQRQLDTATWWLLLEPTDVSFKPSKYTSFNTRHDKLNVPRSAGYKAFRESRCVIPAKGFGETEGKGTNARYTDFEALPDNAIAFGGLCREWINTSSGELALSCSIITLPPHEKLMPYHTKASPLILSQDEDTIDMWLDSSITDVTVFEDLLSPHLPQDLLATPIDKPSLHNPIQQSLRLIAD